MTTDIEKQDLNHSNASAISKMEHLFDNIKLLNYDRELGGKNNLKHIHRHYFAISSNPGEQFYAFCSLAYWLIRKIDKEFEQPQEFDDPNVVIAIILESLRKVSPVLDIVPSKLKLGNGEPCIDVLLELSEYTLSQLKPNMLLPKYIDDLQWNGIDAEVMQMEKNKFPTEWIIGEGLKHKANMHHLEAEVHDVTSLDSPQENSIINERFLDSNNLNHEDNEVKEFVSNNHSKAILWGPKNSGKWFFELESAIPHLKFSSKLAHFKDWHSQLEEMKKCKEGIIKSHTKTIPQLVRLKNDLNRVNDQIRSKEKYLNSQLLVELDAYRSMEDQLKQTEKEYEKQTQNLSDRAKVFSSISSELNKTKQEIEKLGNTMVDGSPVDHIKQAIRKLRNEIMSMNVRIGVLLHMHLRSAKQSSTISLNSIASKNYSMNSAQ